MKRIVALFTLTPAALAAALALTISAPAQALGFDFAAHLWEPSCPEGFELTVTNESHGRSSWSVSYECTQVIRCGGPVYASVLDSAEITGVFEDPNGENEYVVTLDCSVLNVPNEG